MLHWLIGFAGAAVIAGLAYLKRSLSLSGLIAAVIMGTIYYGAGSAFWFGILLVFFITSTVLSKWKKDRKSELEKSYAKTGTRDAGQVFANGGLGMLICLGYVIAPSLLWVYVFVGVMATVTSDTWATELGGLSRKPPRSVLTGRVVPKGTSGGVSLMGNAASLAGGLCIGLSAWLLLQLGGGFSTVGAVGAWALSLPGLLLSGGIGGFAGAMADSVLGATVQKMYRCPICRQVVEVERHCGHDTELYRGWSWMTNDAVNLISSAVGGLVALGLGFGLGT
ncbi:DUF92 domain-containing protein [Paenibacillus physcomitrellae]|uniref:DUF92 domain-containing protein n=1 Tax=Paenibacillus physcomitrellae TaxID=1619311 RepID=A0ABQ1GIY3_9BACL|nr:DUF92 domain-containing protein [Paenibacillus physcomitrellae]GGA44732.1 hypothetical protein GCM10010917_32570 [Paenibacillus physcomitrellae]